MNHEDSMISMSAKHCVPCEGGFPPLTGDQIQLLLKETPRWNVVDNRALTRHFEFRNFREALKFINRVGDLAETEGHHPNLNLYDYKFVTITLSTHAIDGLSENDFIMAAKIDRL